MSTPETLNTWTNVEKPAAPTWTNVPKYPPPVAYAPFLFLFSEVIS